MPTPLDTTPPRVRHWRATQRLTMSLLAVCVCATFGSIFFARELAAFQFFAWPLSFYLSAQGCLLLFLAIVGYYAWRMDRIDAACAARPDDTASETS